MDLAFYRSYDPTIGRWMQIDPAASKYYSISPYSGMSNNPITFSDHLGDTISLAVFQMIDKNLGTNITNQIISQLSDATGLSLSLDSKGNLAYAKEKGETGLIGVEGADQPKVNNLLGKEIGSSSARSFLVKLIGGKDIVTVSLRPGGKSVTGGNSVSLDPQQIGSFVSGADNSLNNRTLGLGMTLLHELHHTTAGGGLGDVSNRQDLTSTGPVVDRMNIIRSELDRNSTTVGQPYGVRTHYNSVTGNSGVSTLKFKISSPKRAKYVYIKF